jgi:hypothetical protein
MNVHMLHFHKWITNRARNFCLTSDWAMTSTPLDIADALSRLDSDQKYSRRKLPRISLGKEFTLVDQYTQEKVQFVLASPNDSDPENGRLSFLSPLGLKVVGLFIGEVAKIKIFGRAMTFEVVDIRNPDRSAITADLLASG